MARCFGIFLPYLSPSPAPRTFTGYFVSLARTRIARSANVSPPRRAAPSSANHRGLPTARRRSARFRLVGVAPRAHPKPLSHTRRYTRRVYAITPAGGRRFHHHRHLHLYHRYHYYYHYRPPLPQPQLPVVITTTLSPPSSPSLSTTTTTMIGQQRRMVTSPALPTRLSRPCKTGATLEYAEYRKPLRASPQPLTGMSERMCAPRYSARPRRGRSRSLSR